MQPSDWQQLPNSRLKSSHKIQRAPSIGFRYHAPSKVIVYGWVNDGATKRAYESSDDAYRVFSKMLESSHPPSDWDQLLAEARGESDRLQRLAARVAQDHA